MFNLGRVKKITKSNLDYFQKEVYFPFEKPKTLKFLKKLVWTVGGVGWQ